MIPRLNNIGVQFDEDTHTYIYKGKEKSGITSLIHAYTGLCNYPTANDYVRNVIIPKAGAKGDSIHKGIQHLEETGEKLDYIDITYRTGQYKDGKKDHDVISVEFTDTFDIRRPISNYQFMHCRLKTIACEHLVAYGDYASAIDNVSVDSNGKLVLIDYKSNNLKYLKGGARELQDYLSWQLGFYKLCIEDENPLVDVIACKGYWLRENEFQEWNITPKSKEEVLKMLETKWEKIDGNMYYYLDTPTGKQYLGSPPKQLPF